MCIALLPLDKAVHFLETDVIKISFLALRIFYTNSHLTGGGFTAM